ncbi:Uncharacterised protein [Mycobacteroides abscessus subsp. abscessus]|nr:Uncharacterised protein [Mycobacteroides abscessus subsp. abscessus]
MQIEPRIRTGDDRDARRSAPALEPVGADHGDRVVRPPLGPRRCADAVALALGHVRVRRREVARTIGGAHLVDGNRSAEDGREDVEQRQIAVGIEDVGANVGAAIDGLEHSGRPHRHSVADQYRGANPVPHPCGFPLSVHRVRAHEWDRYPQGIEHQSPSGGRGALVLRSPSQEIRSDPRA